MFNFLKRLFFITPVKPHIIQIEITNKCNLDCAMCPRKSFGLAYEHMDFNILKQVAKKIPPFSEVILTGWGEPLLHSNIHEVISLFKKKDCFVRLTTNGTLLSNEMVEKLINDGLDSISVSIDSFETLDSNDLRHKSSIIKDAKDTIKDFIAIRADKKKPFIIIQPTLHKGKENELLDLIREGKRLGVDKINIVRLDTKFNKNLKSLTAKEEYRLSKELIALSDKLKIEIDFLPFIAFTGLKRVFFIIFGRLLFRKNRPCSKLYNYLYITNSGKVTPCCSLPKYEVGDLLSRSLNEIWNGSNFKEFREKSNLICKDCNILRLPDR